MRLSTNFFKAFGLAQAFLLLTATIPAFGEVLNRHDVRGKVALLPAINLSGAQAPVTEMQRVLARELVKRGVTLLDDDSLEGFMARHRVRFTGGIDDATATLLKAETGVDSVLVMSIQQYSTVYPPKVAIDLRLVSAGPATKITWADGVAMAGDDSPGLFGLGLVESPEKLSAKVLQQLSDSLVMGMAAQPWQQPAGRFKPRMSYSAPGRTKGGVRIAVIPFDNRSQRKNAGEIMAGHFVRELARKGVVTVVEPGVVRQKLLAYRVIMDEGLSLANADIIFQVLDVDLILTGDVMEYEDYEGSAGVPQVEFSTRMFDRGARKIVWASHSHNGGGDRVYFFEMGKYRTAHGLAAQMVRGTVGLIALPPVAEEAQNTTTQVKR